MRTNGEPPAVRTVALGKTYPGAGGAVTAVRALDLKIAPGELFGLLGPNGAGKSTTIGMLTTLVLPSSGTAYVCGVDVARHPVEVKRRIGRVAQHNTLDHELTVAENLEFRGRYFGQRRSQARRRADELLATFGLADRSRAMAPQLSGGQARRLMICRALVHRPDVLFLDEPTAGLDTQARINLWEILRQLRAQGQTIVLTTHYLAEAEALCDRVAIIDHGGLLACDTVNNLTSAAATSAADATTVTERSGAATGSAPPPSLETVFLALTGREYRQ